MTDQAAPFVYLDHNATTPCDPRVVEAMLPWFSRHCGNPGSVLHAEGRRAHVAVQKAREQVSELLGAHPAEIVFTGSATESIALAILGFARASDLTRKRVITSAVEHKAVLGCAEQLAREGFEVITLPVNSEGLVDQQALEEALRVPTLLVSIQAANNETGVLQEVPTLANVAHRAGAVFHCDAAQYVGKLPPDVSDWGVELQSFSAHKLYGPKGVGALYLRGGPRQWALQPLVFGGGQEAGLRSGTANVPALVGFGVACMLASDELEVEAQRQRSLRDELEQRLFSQHPSLRVNGQRAPRLPGTSSITFPGVESEALILRCPELGLGNGSACNSGAPEPSHVLRTMGLSQADAWATVRIGLGRNTTQADIRLVAARLSEEWEEMGQVTAIPARE